MKLKVLISGGGIAGLAAAWWLDRAGAEVTVLERALEYRPLGHYVALKARGVQLIKELGIYDACRAHAVTSAHLEMFDERGTFLREGDASGMEKALDGYLLLKRAQLHAELYRAIEKRQLVRFGAHPEVIRASDEFVEVDIAQRTERFDLVIGADGVHSGVRAQVFGSGFLRPLGGNYVAMNFPGAHGIPLGLTRTYFGRGQSVGLIAGSESELTVMMYHADGGVPLPSANDQPALRGFLREAFGHFPREVQDAFSRLDETSYVFRDSINRVVMPSITSKRVALVGDAAHCPTFLSGMGSSLALQGAQTLVRAIEKTEAVGAALKNYEAEITPIARSYQRRALLVAPFILSRNPLLCAARNGIAKLTPDWLLSSGSRRFYRAQKV